MNKFFVVLRNETDSITLNYTLNNHSVAELWKKLMIENFLSDNSITNNKPIEKDYCFHGWIKDWNSNNPRNLSVLCEQMNFAIGIVNKHMIPLGYEKIDLTFTLDELKGPRYRDLMNQIHHHFEILIGQVWEPSEWYKKAPEPAKWAIQELNSRCHEIEGAVNSVTGKNSKAIFLSFAGRRIENHPPMKRYELSDSDYLCWENRDREWGMITTYYSQLGKTHKEAFIDDDEYIEKENISAPRYMTGEAILHFNDLPPGINQTQDTAEFDKWLIKNGWDPQDPKLAKGICVIATLDLEGRDWQDIDEKILAMDDVLEIGFIENDKIISQVYKTTWQENRERIIRDL